MFCCQGLSTAAALEQSPDRCNPLIAHVSITKTPAICPNILRSAFVGFVYRCRRLSGPFEFSCRRIGADRRQPKRPWAKTVWRIDCRKRFPVAVERQTLRRFVGLSDRTRWQALRGLRPRLLVVGKYPRGSEWHAYGSRRLANCADANNGQHAGE